MCSRCFQRRKDIWANNESKLLKFTTLTLRALRPIDGRNNRPGRSTIERLVKKFESTGTVQNSVVPVRQRSARNVENIAAAEASVEESPNVSLTRRSQALGISVTSLAASFVRFNAVRLFPVELRQIYGRCQ